MGDQPPTSLHLNIRPDEREKLTECRRNAIVGGTVSGGLAWLITRYLLTKTPLQHSFLARNPGLTYAFVIGYSLYHGIRSTGKNCIKSLATLENSHYGEFARRALQMKEDKKILSRDEFLQKYPPSEQRKLLDPSHIFSSDHSLDDSPSSPRQAPEEPVTQNDMFYNPQQPEPPKGPKSFQDLQKQNRSRTDNVLYPHYEQSSPNRQPIYNKPSVRSDTQDTLPPGPEGKAKVKRNEYGDVIYEE
ncbi:hypothetical protein LOD99_16119 [Oopsacas minuta]|uniref:OCIA domain-containing protein 1 n=1 Tax=Oopsacas minuta TaxID=111878 RepID=A0AAV7K964_9METZ|nr:hypothetical protein LOD99_16119 [Oopsacas minuta]